MESTPNNSSSESSNDSNKTSNDIHISSELTCLGCRDGILNQMAHIDEGGCLYEEYTYINEPS